MKRALALLFGVCLLLSLCACGKPASPEEPASEPTTEPTTESTTVPVSAAPGEPAVFSLKTLPEIGKYVSDEKKAYFFDDGPHNSFVPRDDYGEIVPYCAGVEKYFATDWTYEDPDTGELQTVQTPEEEEGLFPSYGFATVDGRIITADLFENVFRYEDETGAVLYAAYPGQAFEMSGEVYLISGDGSACLHPEESSMELYVLQPGESGYGKGLVRLTNYDTRRVQLLDFSCKPVFDYNPGSDDATMMYLEYAGRDSAVVRLERGDDTRYACWSYDGKQKTAYPASFNYLRDYGGNDVLVMENTDGDYQLVSMDGTVLSQAYASLRWSSYFNCFIAEVDGESLTGQCFDADGRLMEDRVIENYDSLDSGYSLEYLYDPDEQVLLNAELQKVPLAVDNGNIVLVEELFGYWPQPGACLLHVCTDTEDQYVFSNSGERLAKFQDVEYTVREDLEEEETADYSERTYSLSANDGLILAKTRRGFEIVDIATQRTMTVQDRREGYFETINPLGDGLFQMEYVFDDGTYQRYYDLFRRGESLPFLTGAACVESYGPYTVAATTTHSYLLDQTGKVLLCLKNDKLV